MDKKRIQSILQEALEEEIPSVKIQLWPAVQASLDARKVQLPQQGERMNNTNPRHLSRLAFTSLVVIALLTIILITPQGRTFAQSILTFFTRSERTSFLLQPYQIATQPDSSAPTAIPLKPLISVADAETQVGFEVAELPFVPKGLNYLGARLYGNTVSIEYETSDKGGHLMIQQSQEGFMQSEWDQVPAEAIVPVKIGDLDAELVRGTFVVYPGENSATWNPDMAMLRLRWEQNGVWYEIAKLGNVESIDYLDQTELVKLAEKLSIQP